MGAIEALCRAFAMHDHSDMPATWHDSYWSEYKPLARAALIALSENITPGMVEEFWEGFEFGGDVAKGIRAMLAEAMKEQG